MNTQLSCLFHGGANTILGVAVVKKFLKVLKMFWKKVSKGFKKVLGKKVSKCLKNIFYKKFRKYF